MYNKGIIYKSTTKVEKDKIFLKQLPINLLRSILSIMN